MKFFEKSKVDFLIRCLICHIDFIGVNWKTEFQFAKVNAWCREFLQQ